MIVDSYVSTTLYEGVTPLIVRRIRADFREYSVRRDPGTQYAKNAGHSVFRIQAEI